MVGYEYVKFSKSTAKENPEMIIDAYYKKICELRTKIKPLHAKNYTINISINNSEIDSIISMKKYPGSYDHIVELKVNSDEVIAVHNKIQKQLSQELMLEKKMYLIVDELNKFKRRFK